MSRTVRPVKRSWTRAAIAVAAALSLEPSVATGQPSPSAPESLPAVIKADEINYDQDLDIVTASGNVEITQGDRVLRADTVSFNRRANLVAASGNVTMLEPTGDVLFADYVELTENFRDGIVQNFRAILADQSRLAAVSARRADGNVTAARKVVYSPCELCRTDPTRAPLWQIKAATVTHDQQSRSITYNDAWMEIFGVPAFYTPYLSHPDGTVRRESGFLAPEFGSSTVLGRIVLVPYYQTIGNSADVTIAPLYVSEDRPVLTGEYRERTTSGALEVSASITSAHRRDDSNNRIEGSDTRGHVKGVGRFDINEDWRWGFDVARASDDTYLQRYKLLQRFRFLDQNTLTSTAFIDGYRGRSFASASGFAFQGLRPTDDSGLTPLVLPLLEYSTVGEPGAWGGRFFFDSNALSIYRSEGTRTQRLALQAGWTLPYTAPSGHIYTFTARMLGEGYNVTNIDQPEDPNRPSEDGVLGRAFPQVALGWRYPLVNRGETFRTIIEPVAQIVAAPNVGNQSRFPNEDSRGVDLDPSNLFRLNRFSGLDRLEGGQRIDYGFNLDVQRLTGGRATLFLGQSYRLQEQTAFPTGSGLEEQTSNIVGRVSVSPHPWVSASYQFQLDKDNLDSQRSLASVVAGPPALRVGVGYAFFERSTQSVQPFDIEQLSTGVSANLTQHWRLQLRDLRSLGEDSGQLIGGASLIYEDECILAGIDFSRRRIGNRDNPPDDTVLFRVVFRNLGEVRTQVY